jgi:LacI family transcriptional regulator, galactose operon repressor
MPSSRVGAETSPTASGRSSMRQVAEMAGVAMSSVSRVLSGHPDVSPAMRERVMEAVERLGYEPDLLAQSLRRKATRSVGFVVGDISNPLLAEITLGAETTLREAGYSMLLTNSENDPALDASHVRLLMQRRVDGLMLSLASEDHH